MNELCCLLRRRRLKEETQKDTVRRIVELAQGDKSVTGEHSPYNNMGKMGKKLAKRPIYRIFSFKRPNFDQKNLYFSTHIIYMTKGEFPWGKVLITKKKSLCAISAQLSAITATWYRY